MEPHSITEKTRDGRLRVSVAAAWFRGVIGVLVQQPLRNGPPHQSNKLPPALQATPAAPARESLGEDVAGRRRGPSGPRGQRYALCLCGVPWF